MKYTNDNALANMVLVLFKLNGSKLAKTLNKLLTYVVLAVFCINVLNSALNSVNLSFSQLGNKVAHSELVANITAINKSGNSFNNIV